MRYNYYISIQDQFDRPYTDSITATVTVNGRTTTTYAKKRDSDTVSLSGVTSGVLAFWASDTSVDVKIQTANDTFRFKDVTPLTRRLQVSSYADTVTQKEVDDVISGLTSNFSRSSNSYDDDLNAYQAGMLLHKTVTVSTPPTASQAASSPANIRFAYQHIDGGVPIGFTSDTIYHYKGGSWSEIAENISGNIQMVWVLADQRTVLWIEAGTPYTICKGTYTGSSVSGSVEVQELSTNATVLGQYNLRDNGSTIMFGEYALSGISENGIKVWKSTDNGATWTAVKTQTAGHCHAVAYHATLDAWIAAFGDYASGTEYAAMYVTYDSGTTWTAITGRDLGADHGQPVGLLDIGNATKLLCGSDRYGQIYLLDIVSGEKTIVFNLLDLTSDGNYINTGYVFDLVQVNGIIYACSVDNGDTESDNRASIWASSDGINWAHFAKLTTGYSRAQYGAYYGGNVHFTCYDKGNTLYQQLITKPASISTRSALNVQPVITNLLDDAQALVDGTSVPSGLTKNISPYTGSMTADTDGRRYAQFSDNSGADLVVTWECPDSTINPAENDVYTCKALVRVTGVAESVGMRARYKSPATVYGDSRFYTLTKNKWTWIEAPAKTCGSGIEKVGFAATFYALDTDTITIDVAAMQITSGNTQYQWQLGGDVKSSDQLRSSFYSGASGFTEILCIRPSDYSYHGSGDQAIKIWQKDSYNYAALIWDATNGNFDLDVIADGTAGTSASIDADSFGRGFAVWIIVRHDGSDWTLSVINGGAMSSDTAEDGPAVTSTVINSANYDRVYSTTFACDLIADWLFDGSLTDTQVSAEIQELAGDRQRSVNGMMLIQ